MPLSGYPVDRSDGAGYGQIRRVWAAFWAGLRVSAQTPLEAGWLDPLIAPGLGSPSVNEEQDKSKDGAEPEHRYRYRVRRPDSGECFSFRWPQRLFKPRLRDGHNEWAAFVHEGTPYRVLDVLKEPGIDDGEIVAEPFKSG